MNDNSKIKSHFTFTFIIKISQLPLLLLLLTIFCGCSLLSNQESSKESKKAALLYAQGSNYLAEKNYTEALSLLLQSDKLEPGNTQTLNNLAMAYHFKERDDLAIKTLQKSLDASESNSDARNNLASIYFISKQYQLAEKEYLKVSEDLTYPHQYRTYYNLGLIYLVKKNQQRAKEYFMQSLKEREDYCPAQEKLGELYLADSQLKSALNAFRAASRGVCYDEPAPHYQQGVTLLRLNKLPQAKKKFEEIRNRFPNSEFALLARQQLREVTNNFTKGEKGDKKVEDEDNQHL